MCQNGVLKKQFLEILNYLTKVPVLQQLSLHFFLYILSPLFFIKEHLAYVRRRRSMQMNLQRGHSDLGGLKTAISEAHLASSNSMYFRAPSPKLSNFMQEFTSERSDFHVSLPARIHAI